MIVPTTTASCSQRCSWRRADERQSLREVLEAVRLDEAPLRARVDSMLAEAEGRMRAQLGRGVPAHEAQQAASFEFNRAMQHVCMKAMQQRDIALIRYAKQGAAALANLQRVGALAPPWLLTHPPGRSVQQQLGELADTLDGSRESREYEIRARAIRTVTAKQYNQLRPTPESMADPTLEHVIR